MRAYRDSLIAAVVRKAAYADLPCLLKIYDRARRAMAEMGNPGQWIDGYPDEATIAGDIASGNCYVVERDGVPLAVFALICGDDPTYSTIYEGEWLNNKPYSTLHRLASSGETEGVGEWCIRWCLAECGNLRVDTHADNRPMLHLMEKLHFRRCGIILTHNGSPRIAFQQSLEGNLL